MTEPAPVEGTDHLGRELAPYEDTAERTEPAPYEGAAALEPVAEGNDAGDGADAGSVPGSDVTDAHTPLGEPTNEPPALDRQGDRASAAGVDEHSSTESAQPDEAAGETSQPAQPDDAPQANTGNAGTTELGDDVPPSEPAEGGDTPPAGDDAGAAATAPASSSEDGAA